MKSFFGYPGGKSRLATRFVKQGVFDPVLPIKEYIEPFAGGFSMGLTLLKEYGPFPVQINDVDKDVFVLWDVALHPRERDELCRKVMSFKPSLRDFAKVKARILADKDKCRFSRSRVERAFDKLLVHKLSYSNMGEKAATHVGGKSQKGDDGAPKQWGFDVRWNQVEICKAIVRVTDMVRAQTERNFQVTCDSAFDLLSDISPKTFVYLDPPYYVAGDKCYKHSFADNGDNRPTNKHEDLAKVLKGVKWRWFMTYDNAEAVKKLYPGQWAEITLNYQMSSAYRAGQSLKPNTELVISNFPPLLKPFASEYVHV